MFCCGFNQTNEIMTIRFNMLFAFYILSVILINLLEGVLWLAEITAVCI